MAERLQNFVRSKTHQRRGFKTLRTARLQLQLLFVYYNFVRVHSAIKTTPAEKAGVIEYFGRNTEKERWLFLIERSAKVYFYLSLVSLVFRYRTAETTHVV